MTARVCRDGWGIHFDIFVALVGEGAQEHTVDLSKFQQTGFVEGYVFYLTLR